MFLMLGTLKLFSHEGHNTCPGMICPFGTNHAGEYTKDFSRVQEKEQDVAWSNIALAPFVGSPLS